MSARWSSRPARGLVLWDSRVFASAAHGWGSKGWAIARARWATPNASIRRPRPVCHARVRGRRQDRRRALHRLGGPAALQSEAVASSAWHPQSPQSATPRSVTTRPNAPQLGAPPDSACAPATFRVFVDDETRSSRPVARLPLAQRYSLSMAATSRVAACEFALSCGHVTRLDGMEQAVADGSG